MPNPIRTKIYEMYLKAIGVKNPDELYRRIWSEGERGHSLGRHLVGHLPKNPRCTLCNAPFRGFGAPLMRLLGKPPSTRNPRFCAACEDFMTRHQGGAEVELTMLFADVRGSTTLAERMSASDFSRLMKRFYLVATEVLVNTDALIERLVGDEVVGLFIPGYAGPEHARQAVQAAQELLHVTGHRDPGGPWLPIGVGVHTGVAYLGAIEGSRGTGADITAMGDNVNITARLSSKAAVGEILLSDATYAAAKLDLGDLEQRQLELKGKSELVDVRVLGVVSIPNGL